MTTEEIIHMIQNKAREHLEKAYMLENDANDPRYSKTGYEMRNANLRLRATKYRATFKALSHTADEIQAKHHRYCDECGQSFMNHNDDGSCVNDSEEDLT